MEQLGGERLAADGEARWQQQDERAVRGEAVMRRHLDGERAGRTRLGAVERRSHARHAAHAHVEVDTRAALEHAAAVRGAVERLDGEAADAEALRIRRAQPRQVDPDARARRERGRRVGTPQVEDLRDAVDDLHRRQVARDVDELRARRVEACRAVLEPRLSGVVGILGEVQAAQVEAERQLELDLAGRRQRCALVRVRV